MFNGECLMGNVECLMGNVECLMGSVETDKLGQMNVEVKPSRLLNA